MFDHTCAVDREGGSFRSMPAGFLFGKLLLTLVVGLRTESVILQSVKSFEATLLVILGNKNDLTVCCQTRGTSPNVWSLRNPEIADTSSYFAIVFYFKSRS